MSVARTVLGDVEVSTLGRVDTHDHLMITAGPLVDREPAVLLADVDDAIAEARGFRDAGGGTIVDALPAGCGRDPQALRDISRATGVHVIATTGFYRSLAYPSAHWVRSAGVEELVAALMGEVVDGMDRGDFRKPAIAPTGIRPGVLKVATSLDGIDRLERRLLHAVALAHRRSGLPVLTHAEQGTFGSGQLDLLDDAGVASTKVMVGHLDRLPDIAAHRALARRGAFLGYDGLAREQRRPYAPVAAVIRQLVDEGFSRQLLLGGDVGRRSMRSSMGGPGIAGVLTTMGPALVASGVAREAVEDMLVANAARFLQVTDDAA